MHKDINFNRCLHCAMRLSSNVFHQITNLAGVETEGCRTRFDFVVLVSNLSLSFIRALWTLSWWKHCRTNHLNFERNFIKNSLRASYLIFTGLWLQNIHQRIPGFLAPQDVDNHLLGSFGKWNKNWYQIVSNNIKDNIQEIENNHEANK